MNRARLVSAILLWTLAVFSTRSLAHEPQDGAAPALPGQEPHRGKPRCPRPPSPMDVSRRMRSAERFVKHYATHDNEVLHSLLADDCVFEMVPSRSIGQAQTLDKAGFLRFKDMKMTMTDYPLKVIKYIESESSNAVVVWTTGRPQFREELKDYDKFSREQWDYTGEFIFMLTMDETGDKIATINEFIDSKATELTLQPLVARALSNLESRRGHVAGA